MFTKILENVNKTTPLVHCITNYVTVNDVANVLLACGGSPIMSDDSGEVEEITSICGGLNINIGTLNKNTIPSMFLAGKKANDVIKYNKTITLEPMAAYERRIIHMALQENDRITTYSVGEEPYRKIVIEKV